MSQGLGTGMYSSDDERPPQGKASINQADPEIVALMEKEGRLHKISNEIENSHDWDTFMGKKAI